MSGNWFPSSMSRHLHPHLSLLHQAGVSVEHELERHDLPVEIVERGDIRYATRFVGRFLHTMEKREGIPDLCYLGAKGELDAPIESGFRDYLCVAGTLKELISRYAVAVRKYNGRLVSLSVTGEVAKLTLNSPKPDPEAHYQRYSDWSNIFTAILLVRLGLGHTWLPDKITLQARFALREHILDDLPKTRISTGSRDTSISFPGKFLAVRVPEWYLLPRFAQGPSKEIADAGPFPSTLATILRPYLSLDNLSVDLAAEISGTSVRSLQRILGDHGTSFSTLIQRERLKAAGELLEMPGARITEIALDLGYRNPTHFSRAFKRMTGFSPREYRSIKLGERQSD